MVDITALCPGKVVDTSLAVSAIFRILNCIRLQGWFPSPSSSCEHFIQVVRERKLQLMPTERAIFTIRAADITKFTPNPDSYEQNHRWLQEWTWAQARDREGRFSTTVLILMLLGPRACFTRFSSRWAEAHLHRRKVRSGFPTNSHGVYFH